MMMPSPFRKFGRAAHIAFSIGWMGAVVPYLLLSIAGLTSDDAQRVRAAYLSMELIGWFVIVPFSLTALLTGFIQSLGTPWGLFRHWWILVKFLLTVGASLVLLRHMQAVSRMSRLAAETTLSGADFHALRVQLVVHAAGGLLVLFVITTLSIIKPWGLTAYGRRKLSLTDLPSRPSGRAIPGHAPIAAATSSPRWTRVVGIHAVGLFVLFIIVHLAGGGLKHH